MPLVLAVSDAVLQAAIAAGANAIVTFGVVAAAYFALKNKMLDMQRESAAQIEVVAKAANGLTHAITDLSAKEGVLRGAAEERARAEAEKAIGDKAVAAAEANRVNTVAPKVNEVIETKIDDQVHVMGKQIEKLESIDGHVEQSAKILGSIDVNTAQKPGKPAK